MLPHGGDRQSSHEGEEKDRIKAIIAAAKKIYGPAPGLARLVGGNR
jgi:hypothetical protein